MTPAVGRLEEGDKVILSYVVSPTKSQRGRARRRKLKRRRRQRSRGKEKQKTGKEEKKERKNSNSKGIESVINRHKPCSDTS